MTIEHVLVFGIGDIRGFRVECAKCRTSITYDREERFRIPPACPSCREPFETRERPRLLEQLEHVVQQLQALEEDVPVRLRFQIDRGSERAGP
jgi:hypothetical protein